MTRLLRPRRLLSRLDPVPEPMTRWWDTWILAVIAIGLLLVVGSLELALWPGGTP